MFVAGVDGDERGEGGGICIPKAAAPLAEAKKLVGEATILLVLGS